MKTIDKFRNYVLDEEFKITIINGKVNISNYQKIDHFDSNKIIIRYEDGSVSINGKNLVVSKLLKDELLITGNIKNIELKDYENEKWFYK